MKKTAHADAPFSFGGEESFPPFFQLLLHLLAPCLLAMREAAKPRSHDVLCARGFSHDAFVSDLIELRFEHELAACRQTSAHGSQHPCRSGASRDRAITPTS